MTHWVMSHESYYSDTPTKGWCKMRNAKVRIRQGVNAKIKMQKFYAEFGVKCEIEKCENERCMDYLSFFSR